MKFLKTSIITFISATMLLTPATVLAKTIPVNNLDIKPSVFTTKENYVPNDLLSEKEDDVVASIGIKTEKKEKSEYNLVSVGNAEENKKEYLEELERKKKEEEAEKNKKEEKSEEVVTVTSSNEEVSTFSAATQGDALIAISNPDPSYQGTVINLTDYDREVLRHVIMGEAGGEGFAGCAILAQTIRDNWIRGGYSSAEAVRTGCGYYGWNSGTNSDVEAAINYIFDQGQNAVQHRVCFMYNPNMCSSSWHESQNYIVTYGPVRYFDAW